MMNLGLDIDGTIDENPEFFRLLSESWPGGSVYIITHRVSDTKARRQLADWGIRFDEVHLSKSSEDKARLIKELGISVMIDDSDEVIAALPENVTVLKMRHADNFDFLDGRWYYQSSTGKQI